MKDYLFVNEDHHVLTGDQAKAHIEKHSDKSFITDSDGIVAVDEARWKRAQSYEHQYWMHKQLNAIQDRNSSHVACFGGYEALRGKHFSRAIELGCGPFTNLRMIAGVCTIGECALEDPLIQKYLSHPNCAFTPHGLALNYKIHKKHPLVRAARFIFRPLLGSWGVRLSTALSRKLSPNIPVTELISAPIETMPTQKPYDLVVMVNVLEHCRSIPAIFDTIRALSAPGSYFVFADKMFNEQDISRIREQKVFEAGHPLMPKREYIEKFLADNFTPVYQQFHRDEVDTDGFDWSHDILYYIGVRKA